MKAKRDKFSGHWWIPIHYGLCVEAYRSKRHDWELVDVYNEIYDKKSSMCTHRQLDHKRNIVYPYYRGQAVPSFCSLRAMINWVESIP